MKPIGNWHLKHLLKFGVVVLPFVLFYLYCGSSQIKYVTLEATKDLNKGGNACYVCMYQLIDDQEFRRTPLESFWREGEKAFEKNLVGNIECRTLVPGDLLQFPNLEILKETNYIGVAADFRDPDKEGWRQVFPIPPNRPRQIQIIVGYNSVSIEPRS